jgi:hypothetical protein
MIASINDIKNNNIVFCDDYRIINTRTRAKGHCFILDKPLTNKQKKILEYKNVIYDKIKYNSKLIYYHLVLYDKPLNEQ